ncbi:MAG: hypothetical protein EOP85_20345 [Verrucomicrobiaceae bacterium]|nr:MAG: hypothetical protein EOP85_20345 [Verrucomicrobiaceae bacterium]
MSGWAAAAVVTLLLLVKRDPPVENSIAIIPPLPAPITRPTTIAVQPSEENSGELDPSLEKETDLPEIALTEHTELTGEDGNKVFTRQETRQLIQEIEVLKERLQDLQQHGQERFEVVPGTARPIVMRMSPPGIPAEVPADISLDYEEPPMTAILGDALASANDHSKDGVGKSGPTSTKLNPSAVPICDPELNTGTLVVLNLPTTGPEESYNLWVKTAAEEAPVYVGRLPKSENRAADSFDFSLGSGGVVPTGFMLTRDSQGKPTEPAASNTVLQGP